jgi:hypothetical protein
MCPEDSGKPNLAAAFMPFGLDNKGGLSLATGWLGGTLGGTERIVVGQLAGPGKVKVFSNGSALQGGLSEMASFTTFDGEAGVTVATTSNDTRRRPAGERRLGEGQDRSGGKVPVGQALAASDQYVGQEARHGGVEGRFSAECAWRRLRASRLRLTA